MSTTDESVRQQIAALRVAYVQHLPGKLQEVRESLDAWVASQDADELFKLYRLAHSLAGSGAIYGLAEVSEKARAMEHFVKPFAEKKAQAAAADVETMRVHLAALAATIGQIPPP